MSILNRYTIKPRAHAIKGLESFIVRFYVLMMGFVIVGIIFAFGGVNPFAAYFELIRIAFFTECPKV